MSEINNKEVENTVQSETKEDWKNAEAAEPKESVREKLKEAHQDDKPSESSEGDREIGAKSKGTDDLGITH